MAAQNATDKRSEEARTGASTSVFRSPLRYPGGKQKAIDQISQFLPTRAREYREPMVGGGSVFFHARSRSFANSYWINDKFKELISFWRTAQHKSLSRKMISELWKLRAGFKHPEEIKAFYLDARAETPQSEYREALLFFFFNRVTFSGTTGAGGFSRAASMSRFTESSIERLKSLPEALSDVRITNLDFEQVIKAPGEDVFIFLDPPYLTANKLYGKNGSLHDFDHERLSSVLKQSGHRFLITYDDCDEVRKLYRWAQVTNWTLQYGMNNCSTGNLSKVGSELFIANYNLR